MISVKVTGLIIERLIDRALSEGMEFEKIERVGEREALLDMDDRTAGKFIKLADKYSYKPRIVRRSGMSAIRARLFARWTMLAGFLIMFAVLGALTSRVWVVRVEGDGAEAISRALDDIGVAPGAPASSIDTDALEVRLYEKTGGFSHISARIKGVYLIIEAVSEVSAPELYDPENARDLVADADAVIVSIDALAGTAKVRPGDVVVRGQVLISGEERISREETGGICAMGVVIARTWHTGAASAGLERAETRPTGRIKRACELRLFDLRYAILDEGDFETRFVYEETLPIVGLFLPLKIVRTSRVEYEIERLPADIEALKADISKLAYENAISTLPDGCIIIDKWIDYSMIEGETIGARAVVEAERDIAVTRAALNR